MYLSNGLRRVSILSLCLCFMQKACKTFLGVDGSCKCTLRPMSCIKPASLLLYKLQLIQSSVFMRAVFFSEDHTSFLVQCKGILLLWLSLEEQHWVSKTAVQFLYQLQLNLETLACGPRVGRSGVLLVKGQSFQPGNYRMLDRYGLVVHGSQPGVSDFPG